MKELRVDLASPAPEACEQAAHVLQGGGIIASPTDTVYGLLASINRPDALARLIKLKRRPSAKPFLILAADWIMVRSVTSHLPAAARILGSRYWPGPMTLILPAGEGLPDEVRAIGDTVGIRVPQSPWLLSLLRTMRRPLVAPSANPPDEEPAETAAQVRAYFGDELDLIIDGGESSGGQPSALIDCIPELPVVLREGALGADVIQQALS